MSTPRKHHYLPRFYLRGFSSNSRSLIQIEKASGSARPCSVNDAASIRDYHRLDAKDVEDPYEFERRLSSIEGALAAAVKRVLENGISDLTTHARLVELVSMLRVRIPAMKSTIEKSLRQVVRSTGLIMERSGKLPAPPPGLEDALRMDNLNIKISNWVCLQYMFSLAADKDILRLLLSMRPSLVHSPENCFFITCDQPVAVFSPLAKLTRTEGVALTEPDVQISLPLSRSTLLLLDWRNEEPASTVATAVEAEEFNRRTVIMATNYVFAPVSYEVEARAFVARYGQLSAGMQPPQTLDAGRSVLHLLHFLPVISRERYKSAG